MFFYKEFEEYDPKAAKAHLRPAAREPLEALRAALAGLDEWTPEAIQHTIEQVAEGLGVKLGKVGMPLRVAVSGRGASPSNDQTLALLGREKTLQRIDRALAFIRQREAQSA